MIGDVIFASAIKLMSDLGREDGATVSHAIAQVSKGALHEPLEPLELAEEIESDTVNGQLYEKIIRLKTGILFGTACHLGAIAAGTNTELTKTSYRYGLRIGEAYQIADDLDDVKRYLSSQSMRPRQMVALAPAILHFARGMRPHIIALLRGETANLNEAGLEPLRIAADLMEEVVEHRLQLAVFEMQDNFPHNGYSELVQSAPRDIIRMFNES